MLNCVSLPNFTRINISVIYSKTIKSFSYPPKKVLGQSTVSNLQKRCQK